MGGVFAVQGDSNGQIISAHWAPMQTIYLSQRTCLAMIEGGSRTYNVRLSVAPTSDGVAQVSRNNAAVTVNKAGGTAEAMQDLTFSATDWNTAQPVVMVWTDADAWGSTATLRQRSR